MPGASCDLPGGSRGPRSNAPIFGLAPDGVYLASPVTRAAGELLPHRFTLAFAAFGEFAVCSLLHFPWGHPPWVLPSTLPCGVRTFLQRSRASDRLPYSSARLNLARSARKVKDSAMAMFVCSKRTINLISLWLPAGGSWFRGNTAGDSGFKASIVTHLDRVSTRLSNRTQSH